MFVKWHHQRHRLDQMRGQAKQPFALAQRLAHQRDVAMLQIAQAAVDEPAGPVGRAAADIFALDQRHPQAARGRVPRDASSINPRANDDQIEDRSRRGGGA